MVQNSIGTDNGASKRTRTSIELESSDQRQAVSALSNKKHRAIVSCSECSRRKQRCDRKEPCTQCVARNVPHLCGPVLDAQTEETPFAKLETRMANMEQMLGQMMAIMTTSGPQSIASQSNLRPGPDGAWGPKDYRRVHLLPEEDPKVSSMLGLLQQSGVTKTQVEHLVAGIPGKRLSCRLVELYFEEINWTRYPIHRPDFSKRCDALFDSLGQEPLGPQLDVEVLRWLPVLFSVLGIAAHEAPLDIIPLTDQVPWAQRLYASMRLALDVAKALQKDNLDVLMGALLISRYTLVTRRAAEGAIPLSLSFPLGLYRDGSILHMTDDKEIEIRRRAWAMLYHLDRSISLLVGRPPIISDAHTDTKPPANLEDDELETEFEPAGHPLSHPTAWTYIIVRHQLAEILGRIAYHTFAVKQPVYQTVLDLDSELLAWQASLPRYLAMIEPDASQDATRPYLSLQRYLLSCEWYYARVILHRPYILRRGPHEGYFIYSQNAAVESAQSDLLNRRNFVMEKGPYVNRGGYRLLDSIMVLAVIIKLEPDTPRAVELQNIVDIVTARQPDSSGRISDPLGQDEMFTVKSLTARPSDDDLGQANVRDEQMRSLANFVKTPTTSADQSALPLHWNDNSASWPPTGSSDQSNLASWASMFEPEPAVPVEMDLSEQNSSSTFLNELMESVEMQQSLLDPTSSGQASEQRFNPFALAQQSGQNQGDVNGQDEQLQLYNFLLSMIANQQPVGQ